MRRLTGLIILFAFLAVICRPGAAYSVNQPTDLTEKGPIITDDDIVACADEPAPGMDGRIPGLAGKPINLLSGAETTSRVDLRIGNLFPIAVKRSYNSSTAYDSPLGYGWAVNYDRRLYTYPDGSVTLRKECGWKRRFTWSVAGYITPLGESGTLVYADGTYTHTDKNGDKDIYDAQGRLVSEIDAKGNSLRITYKKEIRDALWGLLLTDISQTTPLIVAYDYKIDRIEERNPSDSPTGASVTFQYDSNGRLASITDGTRTITYGHDTFGNLTTVSGPGVNATYEYPNSANIHRMISIDEGNGEYVNTYDSHGRVTQQTHGSGVIVFEYLIPYKLTRITTTIAGGANGPLTQVRTVEFGDKGQVVKATDTLGNVTNYIRDSNTMILREEYWENTSGTLVLKSASDYTYDVYGNMKTKVEASKPDPSDWAAIEKTTTYIYQYEIDPAATLATFNKVYQEIVKSVVNPAQDRTTTNTYDNVTGNLLTTTEHGLLGDGSTYSYTTAYAYDGNGRITSINGPRTDVNDITTYTYDPTTGYLTSMTQPIIGMTTYTNCDAFGNPWTVTDPNGKSTVYTYDLIGRVTSIQAPGDTVATQYFYVTGGCQSCGGGNKIDHITMPEFNSIWCTYDTMGNLSAIKDNANNSINYTYDSEGNKLTEQINSGSTLQKSLSYQYDALNRLAKIVNPDTQYAYDSRGNRTSLLTPNAALTTYSYDPLNRLSSVIQPGSITTAYTYNSNNNLTSVKDANNNTTVYKYDDKGRVYQVLSPDTGTTTYAYDPAGNMISKKDANNVTIGYQYDAANRLTYIAFPNDHYIQYTYDTPCLNGKGRICKMEDASGTTLYKYSAKGQVIEESKTINGVSGNPYITSYSYDQNGNINTITYPSLMKITYTPDTSLKDRIAGVKKTINAVDSNIASNISYYPFGGMAGLTYGNQLGGSVTYDIQYRVKSISIGSGSVLNLNYDNGYDANGNILAIKIGSSPYKSFTYDALDRLSTASGPWGSSLSWTYDGVGNRKSEGATDYNYPSNSNRLSSVGNISYNYDNNGNTTGEGSRTFGYNDNQRLVSVSVAGASYTYNGNGQRVKKVVNGVTTVFHYSLNGQIIAEANSSGNITTEYVYLNGQPLAKIAGGNMYYYHNDHLATPQKMTDSSGVVKWSADYKPFGEAAVDQSSTITNNLRFPGQYYDAETVLNYNNRRDYNPVIGRYVESDPFGLAGGINLYSYTGNNPVNRKDPFGLTWIYQQSTGNWSHVDDGTGVATDMGNGYAGNGAGLNNPAMQNIPNVGPLPQGGYTIGPQQNNVTNNGTQLPASMILTPDPGNNMYGRGGFLFHGDNPAQNQTASSGCPVGSRTLRNRVGSSGDNRLQVIP